VEPLHVQLEKLQRGSLTRREFFTRAAVLGATTTAVAAVLEACGTPSLQSGPAAGQQAQPGAAAKKLTLPNPTADDVKAHPIIFRGWEYEVDTVQDNVKKFMELYKENVDYQTVTGDYGTIIDSLHLNKQPLDMYYAHEDEIAKQAAGNNLMDYEGWWDIDKAKSEMYTAFRDAWTRDGKLYGLPYYTAIRGTIMINKVLAKKAGIDTLQLTTWSDLYDLCRKLKKDGVAQYPLLHHWFAPSWAAAWQFLWENANRGIKLFNYDAAYQPLFNENHESVKVLEEWRQVYADGLVPDSVFNMQEGDFIDAFAKGQFVFSPQQTYDNKRFNDPAKSNIAGMVDWATPPPGKEWGKLEMGGYLMPNRDRDDMYLERVMRHNAFYGYRDQEGNLFVAKRWAIEKALNSGYKSILDDKDVLAAYTKWMPGAQRQFNDMQTYFNQVVWDRFYHCPWHSEWLNAAKAQLDPAILGQKAPKEAMKDLRTATDDLYNRFKDTVTKLKL
jgi:multiple sugar transport system substrate-binding protein